MRTIEIRTLRDTISSALVGHQIITGKSGSGKSNGAEWQLENNYLFSKPRKKCIDFDTSGRFENCSYGLEEDNPRLIMEMQRYPDFCANYLQKPMSFKNEVFMFCGRGLLGMNRLPANIRLVSFSSKDLTWNYLNYLLGKTEALLPTLNELQARFGTDLNMKDVSDIVFRKEYRGSRVHVKIPELQRNMIKNRITSWMQTGIFSDHPSVDKIDFLKMLNDPDTITCVNTFMLQEDWEEEVALSIFMNKVLDIIKTRKVESRVLEYIREISDYMRWKLCRDNILQVLRKGRFFGKSGIDLIADTQRALDLEPRFRRQFGHYLQMKSDYKDAERILEIQFVDDDTIYNVPGLDVGQALIATGIAWHYPVQMPPARHKHVDPSFDIIKLLGGIYGWTTYPVDEIFSDNPIIYEDDVEDVSE